MLILVSTFLKKKNVSSIEYTNFLCDMAKDRVLVGFIYKSFFKNKICIVITK